MFRYPDPVRQIQLSSQHFAILSFAYRLSLLISRGYGYIEKKKEEHASIWNSRLSLPSNIPDCKIQAKLSIFCRMFVQA